MNIQTRNPAHLSAHPDNKFMPRLREGMPEWQALFDDVRARGVQEPLRIHGTHVIDGETRRNVAVLAGLDSVPVVEVPETEVYTTLREKLILQKHLTKGQRALLFVRMSSKVISEVRTRQIESLRKGSGRTIADSVGDGRSLEQICADLGFSRDLFNQASALHGIFCGDAHTLKVRNLIGVDWKGLRDEWEPRIFDLDTPVGLGAALAGIAGQQATRDVAKAPNPETQLELFEHGVETLGRVAKAWPKLRREARPQIVAAWTRVAAGWPPDLRRELGEALLAGIPQEGGQ